jgi:signal transduction histidine kinase
MAVCVAVVAGALLYVNRYYEEQAVIQKGNEVQNISRAVNDWLIARVSEIFQLSRIRSLQSGDMAAVEQYLREWRSRLTFIYSDVYFIRPDGSYGSSDGERGTLRSRAFINQFTRETPSYFSVGPVADEPRFARTVVVAAPVSQGQAFVGVLAGVVPFDVINRMIGFFTLSGFTSYMLVDQSGRIIAHSDDSFSGKLEKEVYGREFTTLTRSGDKMVFVNVLKTTWKFVTFQPRPALLAPIRRINGLVGVSFAIVVAILLAVSFTTTSRTVRPIVKLTEGVERIMAGDFRQHVAVETQDEMRRLADSFNRLSDRMVQIRTDDRFVFLGHIAARMAHEMRRPLHVIQLAIQSMAGKRQFNEKYSEIVLKEVENADRFLTEILHFAKPDMLNLQIYPMPILWEKILQKYRLIAEDFGIGLEYRQANEIPSFYLDVLKIEEAFSNLLDNAFDAIRSIRSPGSDGHRVLIEQEHRPEKGVQVIITDTGCGFQENTIDRVLEPYFTTKEGGTGLGLSIAYRILSAHGATIQLSNTPDGHGRVEILFPL